MAMSIEDSNSLDQFLSGQHYKNLLMQIGTPGLAVDNVERAENTYTQLIMYMLRPRVHFSIFRLFSFGNYQCHQLSRKSISQYLKTFTHVSNEKYLSTLVQKGFANVQYLKRLQQRIQLSQILGTNYFMQLIWKLYDISTTKPDLKQKYVLLSWCQKLTKISKESKLEYDISTDKIDQLLKGFDSCVMNCEDLRLRAPFYVFQEISDVNLLYLDDQDVDSYRQEVFTYLFKGIENRIQVIHTLTYAAVVNFAADTQIHFIDPFEFVELDQYKNKLCDVILQGRDPWQRRQVLQNNNIIIPNDTQQKKQRHSQQKDTYIGVGQLNMRSFNCSYLESVITLTFPESLISVSLVQSSITNFGSCTNIVNLLSERNTYKYDDIRQLSHLKRLQSTNDTYTGTDPLLLDLFQHNQLEFIYIIGGTHISDNVKLWNNIDRLRFLYIKSQEAYVTLNVSSCEPIILQVFYVRSYKDNEAELENAGSIVGPANTQEKIQKILIHDMQ